MAASSTLPITQTQSDTTHTETIPYAYLGGLEYQLWQPREPMARLGVPQTLLLYVPSRAVQIEAKHENAIAGVHGTLQ